MNIVNMLARKELFKQLHSILLEWDPIGVKDIDEAQDEYDSYIPEIYKLLVENSTEEEIFKYLVWVESDRMGLSPNIECISKISKSIYNLVKR